MPTPQTPTPDTRHLTRYLPGNGARLYWQEWRPKGVPAATILLIHGQGDHGGRYADFGAALNGAGFALNTIDLRGNGRSDGRRGDTPGYDALLDDIDVGVRECRHDDPERQIYLMGHSMGAQLVVNYVLRRGRPTVRSASYKPGGRDAGSRDGTLSGVILCSPWFLLAIRIPAWKEALGRALARLYPSYTFRNNLTTAQLSHDAAYREALDPERLAHGSITARLAAGLIDSGKEALAGAPLFDLPLLVMQAGMDEVVDPRATARFVEGVGSPDCTYRVYPGSRHELLHDSARGEVIAQVISWLAART
jgi:alpha-beta hydrolase superfamily lysophospholipase